MGSGAVRLAVAEVQNSANAGNKKGDMSKLDKAHKNDDSIQRNYPSKAKKTA